MTEISVVLIEERGHLELDEEIFRKSGVCRQCIGYDSIETFLNDGAVPHVQYIFLDMAMIKNDEIVSVLRSLAMKLSEVQIIGIRSYGMDQEAAADFRAAGVTAVLARPFGVQEIKTLLTGDDEREEAAPEGKVIVFFGPKGKSGRTTLTVNTAVAAARKTGKKVLILDADVQFADIDVFLGIHPEYRLLEMARSADFVSAGTIEKNLTKYEPNIFVAPGIQACVQAEQATADSVVRLVQTAKKTFDYIFIDLPGGFNPMSVSLAEIADHVSIAALMTGIYELQHMRKAIDTFIAHGLAKEKLSIVISRVPKHTEILDRCLEEELGMKAEGLIPNAYMLNVRATDMGMPAIDLEPESEFAQAVRSLLPLYGI